MKKTIITLLFLHFAVFVFSQSSRLRFSGQNAIPVQRENLLAAKTIRDVIPACPEHWHTIIDIVSVKVLGYHEGKKVEASNTKEILNDAQKEILKNSDLGTLISIEIFFRWKDTLSAIGEYGRIRKMNEFRLVVLPHIEAEYRGGSDEITHYFYDSIFPGLLESKARQNFRGVEGIFTIDETGKVSAARLFTRSADPEFDKLFLDALYAMPEWKAAQNAAGIKVKQVFTFYFNFPVKKEVASGGGNKGGC